jgi:hypothetical protein
MIQHKTISGGFPMSELSASQCGCNNPQQSSGNGCSGLIWIILLLCICQNGDEGGCGLSTFGGGGGDNNNSCCGLIILLLLLSCCCGNGNGFF